MQIEFSHQTKLRVRYSETDQMGYCYHGNYAQYFEVGRVEALRKLGMSYREMEKDGVMLPVSELTIHFLSPALYDDELTITTKIVELKGSRFYFEYEIKNDTGKMIAGAKTTLAFVSKEKMRPILPPDSFIKLLSDYEINRNETLANKL